MESVTVDDEEYDDTYRQHWLAGQSYAYQCRMSISEIADMSGYDNLGYFSRMFKKSTGSSPRDFRKH